MKFTEKIIGHLDSFLFPQMEEEDLRYIEVSEKTYNALEELKMRFGEEAGESITMDEMLAYLMFKEDL